MLGWAHLFRGDHEAARELFEAALRDQGNALDRFAGDLSRVPLLLDLVHVHAARSNWGEAQAPFAEFVTLMEEVMQISAEAFAERLEQQGGVLASAKSDWSERRRRSQAQGIRLMLER